jgi:hypothetical protein
MKNRNIENFLKMRNGGKLAQTITTEEGLEAVELLAKVADDNGVEFMIAGGLAVQLYGFTRATTDADVFASDVLPLDAFRKLSFGGESYNVQIASGKVIVVDWIVRNDEQQDVYDASLSQSLPFTDDLEIISPEWLVIIKQLAGRGKDELDWMWLLRKDGLIDREKVRDLLRDLFGRAAFAIVDEFDSNCMYADFMKAKDEQGE